MTSRRFVSLHTHAAFSIYVSCMHQVIRPPSHLVLSGLQVLSLRYIEKVGRSLLRHRAALVEGGGVDLTNTPLPRTHCKDLGRRLVHNSRQVGDLPSVHGQCCDYIYDMHIRIYYNGRFLIVCRSLALAGCYRLTDTGIEQVCNHLQLLAKLDLAGCKGLTSACLPHIGKLRYMMQLSLAGLPDVLFGVEPEDFANLFSHLSCINLSGSVLPSARFAQLMPATALITNVE